MNEMYTKLRHNLHRVWRVWIWK